MNLQVQEQNQKNKQDLLEDEKTMTRKIVSSLVRKQQRKYANEEGKITESGLTNLLKEIGLEVLVKSNGITKVFNEID